MPLFLLRAHFWALSCFSIFNISKFTTIKLIPRVCYSLYYTSTISHLNILGNWSKGSCSQTSYSWSSRQASWFFSNSEKTQKYWEWQILTPYNRLESWADILHALTHTHTHARSHKQALTKTLFLTLTRTYTRTYTHMHTHTHSRSQKQALTKTLFLTLTRTYTRTKTYPKTFKLWQIFFPWKFSFAEILTSKQKAK